MGGVETDEWKTQATSSGNVNKMLRNEALRERVGKQQVQGLSTKCYEIKPTGRGRAAIVFKLPFLDPSFGSLKKNGAEGGKQVLILMIQFVIQLVSFCPAARRDILVK